MEEVPQVFVVGFDVHMVYGEKVVDHSYCHLGVFASRSTMECHASMGICTSPDQVVEESDVAVRSYVIEDLEAVVVALSWSETTIGALVVGTGDVNAVVKQPVDGFSRVGIIPSCELAIASSVSTPA